MMIKNISKAGMLRRAFPSTVPVLAGYIFLGIAYGVTLREAGYGAVWALLISMFVYAGSMQFALIGLMTAPFAPLTAALMTLLVNARHIFYGLSMLDIYANTERAKPYLIFSLTDETYSLVCNGAPDGVHAASWFTAISGLNHLYWVTGSVLGGLLGQVLPFDLTGIDFAMTALFTVIVTEQAMDAWKGYKDGAISAADAVFPTALGFVSTIICLILVGKSGFLIAAMGCMLLCFFLRYCMDGRKGELH